MSRSLHSRMHARCLAWCLWTAVISSHALPWVSPSYVQAEDKPRKKKVQKKKVQKKPASKRRPKGDMKRRNDRRPRKAPKKTPRKRRPEGSTERRKPKPPRKAPKKGARSTQAPATPADASIRREGDREVKVMEFSGLDVEGRLKSPQLLYFVHRVRTEFDRPALPHRSFMPELERSTHTDALR